MKASVVVRRRADLLARGTVTAELDGSVHALTPVAIPAAEGEALRACVETERARRMIEVGLGYGISATYICEGLLSVGAEGARHVAIDPQQTSRFSDCGLQVLDDVGLGDLLESVSHAVSFCVTNLGWAVEEVSRSDEDHNWVVLRTPRVPLERAWDHFVEF